LQSLVSAAAAAIALVLAAVAVPALWVDTNIVREDGFIALAAPLGEDSVFQERLAAASVAAVTPEAGLPAPFQTSGSQFLMGAASKLSADPGYPEAWEETLRRSHRLNFPGSATGESFPAGATNNKGAPSSLTLDLTPLVTLLVQELSGSVGVSSQAPDEVLFDVGSPAQRQQLERAAVYTPLAWVPGAGAVVALGLSLVAARRRSAVAVWAGLGLMVVAGVWKLGIGPASSFALAEAGSNPIAELFTQAFLDSARADFERWILITVVGGAGLALTGVAGFAATLQRRRAAAGRSS
jgi:hypothetical protein